MIDLWAELGTFYNQNVAHALDWIAQLANAGVGTIKTEFLLDPTLVSEAATVEYQTAQGPRQESYRALLTRKALPPAAYERLIVSAQALGLKTVISVYDREGIALAKALGVTRIKAARQNLTTLPLLEEMADSGLPTALDVGGATLHEIDDAVTILGPMAIVLHHPGSDPTPPEQSQLGRIVEYAQRYGNVIGFTDHALGEEVSLWAVAAGAQVIEKGVADDPTRAEQDLITAIPLTRVIPYLASLAQVAAACAPRKRVPEPALRMMLTARRDLPAGHRLTRDDVAWRWPIDAGTIPAAAWPRVAGRALQRAVALNTPLRWDDLCA